MPVPVDENEYDKCVDRYKRTHKGLEKEDKGLLLLDSFFACYDRITPVVQIENGRWFSASNDTEQTTISIDLVEDKTAFGSFDNDGPEDAVVLLKEELNTKTIKNFQSCYIAAMKNINGKPLNIATLHLENGRVEVSGIRVKPGEIFVDESSPETGKTRTVGYLIRGNKLIENRIYNSGL